MNTANMVVNQEYTPCFFNIPTQFEKCLLNLHVCHIVSHILLLYVHTPKYTLKYVLIIFQFSQIFILNVLVMLLMRICAWNIIALRDTVCVLWWLFLSNEGALIAQMIFTFWNKRFNGGYNCVLIVRVQNCECTIQNVDTNVYLSNKFQDLLSN